MGSSREHIAGRVVSLKPISDLILFPAVICKRLDPFTTRHGGKARRDGRLAGSVNRLRIGY